MGICMMCHKTIPNGKKFCDNCENNRRMQADESYLDSLLNSVSNNSSNSVSNNPYIKKKQKQAEEHTQSNDDFQEQNSFSDIQKNMDVEADEYHFDAYQENHDESLLNSENQNDELPQNEVDDMLDGLLADMDAAGMGQEEEPANQLQEDDLDDIFSSLDGGDGSSSNNIFEENASDDGLFEIDEAFNNGAEAGGGSSFENLDNYATVTEDDFNNQRVAEIIQEDDTRSPEEIELDNMFSNPPDEEEDNVNDKSVTSIDWDTMGEANDLSVDPALADLFEEVGSGNGPSSVIEINDGTDIEALFSADGDDLELDQIMDDIDSNNLDLGDPSKPAKQKKKSGGIVGWFKKLFGNVEMTPEEIEAEKKLAEAEEQKKLDKAEAAKKNAESKKEMEALEKIKAKEQAEIKKKAAEAAKAKKEAAAKEKAERARKKKEAALAIAEYEIDHSKINKAGATILFVIFAILTIFIIIGTNIYSYKLSIENAQKEFDNQHYNEAYYEVYGLKIQDEDIELYDRIMTVMYVNTQLNSYEYYMKANERERALNSLIKGLQRYEKYYQLATILEISDDLNFVKEEILKNLQSEFNMTEAEAYSLAVVDNSIDYSTYIYGLLGTYDDQLKSIEDIKSIEDLKAFNASLIQNKENY